MAICDFLVAWVGRCQHESPCEKHKDLKCVSCGSPATMSCDETGGLVCGEPLCNNCEHTTAKDGCNGTNGSELPAGLGRHCKRKDQVFKPWFYRNSIEDIYMEKS